MPDKREEITNTDDLSRKAERMNKVDVRRDELLDCEINATTDTIGRLPPVESGNHMDTDHLLTSTL